MKNILPLLVITMSVSILCTKKVDSEKDVSGKSIKMTAEKTKCELQVDSMLSSEMVKSYALKRKEIKSMSIGMPMPEIMERVKNCGFEASKYLIPSLSIENEPYKNVVITEVLFYIANTNMGNNLVFWGESNEDRKESQKIIDKWNAWLIEKSKMK